MGRNDKKSTIPLPEKMYFILAIPVHLLGYRYSAVHTRSMYSIVKPITVIHSITSNTGWYGIDCSNVSNIAMNRLIIIAAVIAISNVRLATSPTYPIWIMSNIRFFLLFTVSHPPT